MIELILLLLDSQCECDMNFSLDILQRYQTAGCTNAQWYHQHKEIDQLSADNFNPTEQFMETIMYMIC